MNRFKKLIDDTRKRAVDAGVLEEPIMRSEPKPENERKSVDLRHVRLPYSSDPKPIDQPWK